jgi:FkbM family methyltransferase
MERSIPLDRLAPSTRVENVGTAPLPGIDFTSTPTDRVACDGLPPGISVIPRDDGWLVFLHDGAAGEARLMLLDATLDPTHTSPRFVLPFAEIPAVATIATTDDRLVIHARGASGNGYIATVGLADLSRLLGLSDDAVDQPLLRPEHRDLVAPAWSGKVGATWRGVPRTRVGPMMVDRRDTVIGAQLARRGFWDQHELDVMTAAVEPGMQVIDVGANVGYFTLGLARLVGPGGRVLAFEPTAPIRALLLANVALNGLDQVTVVAAALGREDGVVTMRVPDAENPGGFRAFGVGAALQTKAVLRRLDDLVDPDVPVGFIKIDAEGWDHRVVEGARRTIERWRPPMIIEFHPNAIREAGDDPAAALRLYHSLGYAVRPMAVSADFGDRALPPLRDAAFIRVAERIGAVSVALHPL